MQDLSSIGKTIIAGPVSAPVETKSKKTLEAVKQAADKAKKLEASLEVLKQIANSKKMTDMLAESTSPEMVSQLKSLLTSIQSGDINSNNEELSSILENSDLGQTLSTFMKGSGLLSPSTLLSSVGVDTDQLSEVAEKVGLGKMETTLSAIKSVSTLLATDSSDPDINTKRVEAAKGVVSAFGGSGLVGLFDSFVSFVKNPGTDSIKGVKDALTNLANSNGMLDKLIRGLFEKALGKELLSVIPGLSQANAVFEVLDVFKTAFNVLNGEASLKDLMKESLEAVGAGLGATILPGVGPLVTTSFGILFENLEEQMDLHSQEHVESEQEEDMSHHQQELLKSSL